MSLWFCTTTPYRGLTPISKISRKRCLQINGCGQTRDAFNHCSHCKELQNCNIHYLCFLKKWFDGRNALCDNHYLTVAVDQQAGRIGGPFQNLAGYQDALSFDMFTGILISLCLLFPGLAWIWHVGIRSNLPRIGWRASAIRVAGCLTIGLLWNTLYAGLLLELGWFSTGAIIGGALTFTTAGVWLGFRRAGYSWLSSARHAIPSFLAVAAVAACVGALPPRGEWLAGGWDPGVYTNQGVHAAQQGSWHNQDSPVFEDIARLPFNPFTRPIAGRDELFPGIPMSPETGSLQLTFYPLTPAWIAFLHSLGGIDAALRAMMYLALILAFTLAGALLRLGLPARVALPATILMLMHPLTIYHARTPCSEMMETVLIVMLGFCLVGDTRASKAFAAPLMPPILLAGILNRPTFLIWSALLMMILAITRRLHTRGLLTLTFPILLGIAYYFTRGQSSLDRIADWFPWLALATLSGICLAALVMVFRRRWRWRLAEPLAFVLAPLLILASTVLVNPNGINELKLNLLKLAPYLGRPLIIFGSLGLLIRLNAVRRASRLTPLDMLLWLGLCAGTIPLAMKFAAELYPWATKRFLPSLPLVFCLASAVLFASAAAWIGSKRKRWNCVPIVLGLAVVLASQASRIRDAWRHTEYSGLAGQLDEIANAVDAADVLLVDHFVWATPLAMVFGRQAINGEPLWQRESDSRTAVAMDFFDSQYACGRRVFILTSTERRLDVFPQAFHAAVLRETFDPYDYYTIAHHRNGNGFPRRKNQAVFRLYEFVLPAPPIPVGENME